MLEKSTNLKKPEMRVQREIKRDKERNTVMVMTTHFQQYKVSVPRLSLI
jgi:hypothetical protein